MTTDRLSLLCSSACAVQRCSVSCTSGVRLKEGGHINRSLLTLSTVIGKLSQLPCNGSAAQASASSAAPAPLPHIPYRDSVLTRILEPALGGNSRTAIIACINEVQHRSSPPLLCTAQPLGGRHSL